VRLRLLRQRKRTDRNRAMGENRPGPAPRSGILGRVKARQEGRASYLLDTGVGRISTGTEQLPHQCKGRLWGSVWIGGAFASPCSASAYAEQLHDE
jgi:hypothetical protein